MKTFLATAILISVGVMGYPESSPPSVPSPVVQPQPVIHTQASKSTLQPPLSVPCAACGTSAPGTLQLTGIDNDGHSFAGLTLFYARTSPVSPCELTYYGMEPNVMCGTVLCNIQVEYRMGTNPTSPQSVLTVGYHPVAGGIGTGHVWSAAGSFDCASMTFVSKAPAYVYRLNAGLQVSP